MSECIAIIPARGGSKRIPKKNIRHFFGKPLIAYSIETALSTQLFKRVVVSTDSEEIAETALQYGAEVPFLRPAELSDDFTGTEAVISHALAYFGTLGETYNYVCTIYATAPLLEAKYLKDGLEQLKRTDAKTAFSCTSMPFPIQRTFRILADGRCKMFFPENFSKRSQDLEEAFQDAGQFYWDRPDKSSDDLLFGKDSIPIVLPRHLVQDIDTLEDWRRAEFMYEAVQREKQGQNSQ